MYIAQLFKGTGIGRYLKMEFFNFDTFKNATHLKNVTLKRPIHIKDPTLKHKVKEGVNCQLLCLGSRY